MKQKEEGHRFFLSFDYPQEFDKFFERKGPETGFFVQSGHELTVGDRVSIVATVKGPHGSIFLEGRVIWRRHRPGGPGLPAGVFVGLVDRDRARLEGIVKYLSLPGKKERRHHQRFPVSFAASYGTSKGEYPSETRNMSKGGAFLHCPGPLLTVGARFPVAISPGQEGKNIPLDARVAWIDYFEQTQGMGVVFIRGQPQLKKIHRLLELYEKRLKKSKDESG